MATISLIVKGPIKSAKRAAHRHGIALASCRVVSGADRRLSNKHNVDLQCYANCKSSTNRAVVNWFTERGTTRPGRGFPPGTLTYHGKFCEVGSTGLRGSKKRRRR